MIENGNLLEVVDKKKTFRGLCVFCLFASDEYGKISIPVYASDFPVQHLKMLVGASFDLIVFDPFLFPKQRFGVLPLCNQNGLLQSKLFTGLLNTGKSSLRKIPWRSKEKDQEEMKEMKLNSKKSQLEDLLFKDVDDKTSS
tara:strand:+ start:195 stop:617 length:423 start_codon:yes stop_codon:yes gene_type:complete